MPFDDAALESQLLWIFGSPRTGSTWLLEQLCDPLQLDESHLPGFSLANAPSGPLDVLPVNEFLISMHVAPAFGEPIEKDGYLVPATLTSYLSHKPAYLLAESYGDVWRPELRRLVLVRLYGVVAAALNIGLEVQDLPYLVIKEVNGSHAADLVMSLFPRSRMLFLVRDGRDVIDSRMHSLESGGWLAEYEGAARFTTSGERLDWLRKACREWACSVDAVQRAYREHEASLRRTVRYEDLLADTTTTLRPLFEWLGVQRSDERLKRIVAAHGFDSVPSGDRGDTRKRRAATPGLWRESLTREERAVAQEVMGSRLTALGYDE